MNDKELRQTLRRFRYDEEHQLDRIEQTNRQRRYKQLLDEQIEQKRLREQLQRSSEVEEKAWYVQPSESYHPRDFSKLPKTQKEEQKHGTSRFVTEPHPSSHMSFENYDDEQVNSYLEECEKILQSLKDLTGSQGSINPLLNHSKRKFIRYDRSKHLLLGESLEAKYDRQFGNAADRLPQLRKLDFSTPKNGRNKNNVAIIINPTPITHASPPEDEQELRKRRLTASNAKSKSLLSPTEAHNTMKLNSSRNSSQNSPRDLLETEQRKPLAHASVMSELEQRSHKSQLQINKERFRMLARQENSSEKPNPQSPSKGESAQKRGSSIMVHLVRVKAHGYKLFEKVKRYNKTKAEQKP